MSLDWNCTYKTAIATASTRASQVAFPTAHRPPTATPRRPLVENNVPMEKARTSITTPIGSLFDPGILIGPFSCDVPFKFPFPTPSPHPTIQLHNHITASGGLLGSVTHVVGLPRIFGLHGDEKFVAKIIRAAIASNAINNPQLMDGGANICLTGILSLLVDVVSIPPFPSRLLLHLVPSPLITAAPNEDFSHLHSKMAQSTTSPATIGRMPPRPSSPRKPSLPPAIYLFAGSRKAIRILARVQFGSLAIGASTTSSLPWRNKMAYTIAPWTSLTLTLTLTDAAEPKSPALPYRILPLFQPNRAAIKLFHQTNLQNPNLDAPARFPRPEGT